MLTFASALLALLVSGSLLAASANAAGSIELHAHLFMKDAMTWAFRGDFDGPLQAKGWSNRFSSMANPEALDRSDIRILVVALYAHPLFAWNMRDAVRHQIEHAARFVTAHPNWIIARDPAEARAALSSGKRVLILALEGAAGILETEEDFAEFVDRKGVRIVTPLHLTDDDFGGVAFLKGFIVLSNYPGLVRNLFGLFGHAHDAEGTFVNDLGLSDAGRALITRMIAHHVWIDLSHASDVAQNGIVPLMKAAGQPLLYTHTALRRYHHAERGISDSQIRAVAESRGIVGLMPGEEMLEGTRMPEKPVCQTGLQALAVQYTELAGAIGASSVAVGSDYNGGIRHLKPGCSTGTPLDREGLWNIGQAPELWDALRKMGSPVPPIEESVNRFLEAWSKVTGAQASRPQAEPHDSRRDRNDHASRR